MQELLTISPEMKKAADEAMSFDPIVRQIISCERGIQNHLENISLLKMEIDLLNKERPPVSIKWRESIKWCLGIDAANWRYFLKSASGVYKCIAYKNKIELTPDIKNKIAITLSLLYKDRVIGRVLYNGIYLYGLKQFFTDDLTDLKEEHKSGLDKLFL